MTLSTFDSGESDEARKFLLDEKSGRNHPKRHRTQKRVKAIAAKKKNRAKFQSARTKAAQAKYRKAVRAYWNGLGDHPGSFSDWE